MPDDRLPTPERVLVVAAHPDDIEFGAAGTVARWVREGTSVRYLLATRGDKGSDDPRTDPAQLGELRVAIEGLFRSIERETGVRGRWMHRRDDPSTYMEVYEDVKDAAAFEALLEREAAKLGIQRKLERFVNAT